MTRFFALSLSRTGTVVSYTMLAASALILACLVWLTYSGLQLAKAEENRYASYLLADELRQSSDDLTRLARTYVVTGDESYEKQYLDILAIRNGEKTRPQNYHRIYWDLVAAGRPASPPSGVRKPLADLMQEAGFTTSEFALLSTAQKNSDGLVALEVEAMNAVKGLFADSAGAYTVKRSPDFERARLLMHSPDYHRFKADIMTPVNTFLTNMEARLAAQTGRIETQMQTASAIALFAALLLVVTAGLSTAVMQRRILRPLAALSQTMRDLAEGATVGTVPGLTRQDELGDMARSTDAFRQSAETALRLSREVEAAAKQREILSRQQAEAAKAAAEAAEREKAMLADSLATAELGRAFQENIALVVERVRGGDLTARAEINPRLEISQRVGGTLNSMLDTIDETFGQIGITLENLASGDLMAAVPKGRGGRYSDILQVAEQTRQRLAALVDNVRNNADQVFDLAQSINSGADDLSRRTVHTAATLEESSAALTELSASVSSAAEGATHADQIVQQTRKAAEASKQVVNEAVAAMTQIEEQAEKIARIIDVIDGIAFQTNLLALNAGVEAARAGDSGRGFAVVASEVRALAQRSSEAAREINGLISTSGTHVAKGAQLVNQTGDALHGIYQSISGLSEHVAAIAVSAREQSNGINDISSAISMIERATTNNAEMVTRTTEVSSSLSQQASALRETLMRFRSAPEAVPQRRRA